MKLAEMFAQVKKHIDETYITDTGSTDNTVEIVEEFDTRISHFDG